MRRKDIDVNIKRMIRNQWEEEKEAFSVSINFVLHTAIVMIAMVLLPTILVLDVFKIPYEQVFWTHTVTCLLSWVLGICTCYFAGAGTFARFLCYFWGFVHLMIATSNTFGTQITVIVGFMTIFVSMVFIVVFTEANQNRFLNLYRRSLIW